MATSVRDNIGIVRILSEMKISGALLKGFVVIFVNEVKKEAFLMLFFDFFLR